MNVADVFSRFNPTYRQRGSVRRREEAGEGKKPVRAVGACVLIGEENIDHALI